MVLDEVAVTSDTTISKAYKRADGYTSYLFNVAQGYLFEISSGASITGDRTNADIYLVGAGSSLNDSLIDLETILTDNLVIECSNGSANVVFGYAPTAAIANSAVYYMKYAGGAFAIDKSANGSEFDIVLVSNP